ncbi:hypothetical protein O988_00576 [Pseudogymnoascus sp. VKM F-3808]|nr:hypothetical protein O988_00576 [Pseudogymnoascus sp. VKM F-3808]
MVSTKGKPTEPKLKERVTEKVKQKTNKDGSGKGKMAAWKAAKIGKEYEALRRGLPSKMGDGLFFNPALFHAAGSNHSADFIRKANLLQISSAFGKAMETIDNLTLIEQSFVSAVAAGYPFPTNLDRRSPAPGGLAPESEQQTVLRALQENWDKQRVLDALRKITEDSRA